MTRPLRLAGRPLALAAGLGAAALALTACGGGSSTAGASSSASTGASGSTSSASGSASATARGNDGTLVIGSLLPQTGSLAFLGPPEFAGVQLAVNQINAAGGVGGKQVTYVASDSGDTSTDIASQSVSRLLSQNADAIIGAASSGVSKTVIDQITNAGVVEFSPANTSPDFTDYPDKGFYWRTAPSDVLQGRVLGDTVVGDGHLDIDIMALNDPYGTGLTANVKKSVEAGGGTVKDVISYDPNAANFSAEVAKVKADAPDALVLIGFDETKKIVPELVNQGVGPQALPLYFSDGNLADYSKDFAPGTLKGTKGTLPGAKTSDAFKAELLKTDPSLTDFSYAPESYDAATLIALAALQGKGDSGTVIKDNLQSVSEGGTKCTSFAECAPLVKAGTDIDYDGQSGPVEFSEKGDPTQATIGIYSYGDDNKYTNLSYVNGKLS